MNPSNLVTKSGVPASETIGKPNQERHGRMNTFQQISRELVVEDLQRTSFPGSTVESDPVKRQLIWRRLCTEQTRTYGQLQMAGTNVTEGRQLLSMWKRLCRCFFTKWSVG